MTAVALRLRPRRSMIAARALRGAAIGIALAVLGCTTTPEPAAPPAEPEHPALAPGCPYASVYVDVSTQGGDRDAKLAERVRIAYAESLGEQGFDVVSVPEEAYWSAFSLVHLNRRVDSTFAWSVYMMATQDLRGRVQTPVRFAAASDAPADLSGFMLLKQVRLRELDRQVRGAAEDTAEALLPHTARRCLAWTTEPRGGQAPGFQQVRGIDDLVEKLRDELAQEIIRLRQQRQRKDLQIGVDPSS